MIDKVVTVWEWAFPIVMLLLYGGLWMCYFEIRAAHRALNKELRKRKPK